MMPIWLLAAIKDKGYCYYFYIFVKVVEFCACALKS